MKIVADTMLWVSYSLSETGFRHRLLRAAHKARVRLFISDYILDEVAVTLAEDFDRSPRYIWLATRAIRRMTKLVRLSLRLKGFVAADPDDDAIVQTALTAKADYLVTGDRELLRLGQVRDMRIVDERAFAKLINFRAR